MKYSLKLTLAALLICGFAIPQAQAMDYARSLFDSNTKKLIWALTAIIITSFATDAPKKLYSFIGSGDPEESQTIWGRIPQNIAHASDYDYNKAQRRIIWLNKLGNLTPDQNEEREVLGSWTRKYNAHFLSPAPAFLGYLKSFLKKENREMLQRPKGIISQ